MLRLVCLVAAIFALLASAQLSHRLAQMAMKEIGPVDHTLPEPTHLLVVRVVDGSFPIKLLAGIAAALLAMAGLFANFSSRLSPAAAGSSLIVICTIAFSAALLLIAATAIAISI